MLRDSRAGQRANLLIRLLTGLVFLPEGMKKFLFPEQWGAGRFARIGIPAPALSAHLVGGIEIVCGLCLLAGFVVRLASIPLIVDMCVAILTTKLPLLWRATAVSSKIGFWSMQGESRTDFAMLMALLFLAIAGAGPWSVDARKARSVPSAASEDDSRLKLEKGSRADQRGDEPNGDNGHQSQ